MNVDVLSREDKVLADRMDAREDLVGGLRYANLVAAANLRMSAGIDALDAWRKARRGEHVSIACALARASSKALAADPLFACAFDGRDRLEAPSVPALSLSVDTADEARSLVLPEAGSLSIDALARVIREGAARLRDEPQPVFKTGSRKKVLPGRSRRRWVKLVGKELRERFDYLLPTVQAERFAEHRTIWGDFALHDIGTLQVEDFKGFLRRPAVAALWALSAEWHVLPDDKGGFFRQRRLPLMLVYSAEIVPLDRACAFLGGIINAIENPEGLEA
ncbi:MAG: hypothetical protein JRF33_08130 [Deltaproteobacteria bacterium]|nr:hypothetical protein [Deltaproteobacteria bacterium]